MLTEVLNAKKDAKSMLPIVQDYDDYYINFKLWILNSFPDDPLSIVLILIILM